MKIDFKVEIATPAEAEAFKPVSGEPIPIGIINYWLLTDQLRMIPSNVFALNGRDRDAERAKGKRKGKRKSNGKAKGKGKGKRKSKDKARPKTMMPFCATWIVRSF